MARSLVARLVAASRYLTQGLVQVFYPAACAVCTQPLDAEQLPFCSTCRQALLADPHEACPHCAATVGPHTHLKEGCPSCIGQRFAFRWAIRLGTYDGLRRDVVLRMKHVAAEGLAEMLAAAWAERDAARLRAFDADVVVPIPLHWRRRLLRGYNQSEALARVLARRLGLPCHPALLRRRRHTPRQTSQVSPAQRRENLKGAFGARKSAALAGKTVLLVDDVLTTGSTCNEAAKTLQAAGAAAIVVAVLTRASS